MQRGREHFLLLFLFFLRRIGCQTAENLPQDQEDLEVPLPPLDPKDPEGKKRRDRKKHRLKSCETFNQSARSCSAVQRVLTHRRDKRWGSHFQPTRTRTDRCYWHFSFASRSTKQKKGNNPASIIRRRVAHRKETDSALGRRVRLERARICNVLYVCPLCVVPHREAKHMAVRAMSLRWLRLRARQTLAWPWARERQNTPPPRRTSVRRCRQDDSPLNT